MTIDFMNDSEYIELCGSKTVLEVVSTLGGIFDKHEFWSYEAKTVGRIVDLPTIRKEISSLQLVLEESRKLSNYFRKTASYLQERELAAQKHVEWLRKQEKEQERLRVAFKAFIRGPVLPKEITDTVLNHVWTSNSLRWEDGPRVAKWTLEDIAWQELKETVLEDSALTNHVKLCVTVGKWCDIPSLRSLMTYPHQWKKLNIDDEEFDVDDFIDVFKPCLPHLEELHVQDYYTMSSCIVRCPRLKTASLSFDILSRVFNAGILNSITSLTLSYVDKNDFPNYDTFKKALDDLPLVLSRLSCLLELEVGSIECGRNDIHVEGLQRVHSTSLRSLTVSYRHDVDTTIAFLSLFVNCSIDCIIVNAGALREAERLFGKARHVVCRGSVPDILFLLERKQDGGLAFPRMDQMKLSCRREISEDSILQLQNRLLESVRMRYEDPTVCRIGHLCIPRRIVTNHRFQDELERYVPSLVLSPY